MKLIKKAIIIKPCIALIFLAIQGLFLLYLI
ncbi:hypothetical protein MHY_22300 [Megamonas hypermegale ART12/1]|nr:hypothetical protein MHY_22300 [Megamonas hypermegale ART12/1]